MRDVPNDSEFHRAARLASMRPEFLANVFSQIQQVEKLDRASLAHRLNVAPEDIDRMALCRRPRQASFRHDIELIASRFGANADALAQTVRLADALRAISSTGAAGGILAAARDADDDVGKQGEPDR